MTMEFAGAAFPITPLLSQCTKIVTILHNVGKKFKRAPLMMTSIATECSLIHVALAQLRHFDWGSVSSYGDGRQEQMTRATESIILGCTLTLSVIEEYAIELQEYVEGSPLSPTEQMGIMARVRVLWKEDEMRELLLQLRGYQTGLTNLIRAAHDSDFNDAHDALSSNSANFGTLLQRSRSSRVRKPLSIRAAMAQAATYSNISRSGTSSNHSTNPSTSTTQSRQSAIAPGTPISSARNSSIQALLPTAADLYDGATSATTNKKPISDNSRRKRPAFLALQPELSETVVDGQTVHTKQDKDQMRKSSPTVGETFTFVPGEPPPEDAPPHPKTSKTDPPKEKRLEEERERLVPTPLHSEPPSGPLPQPPPRSPSRSRSPSKPASVAPSRTESRSNHSRAGSRDELSRACSRNELSRPVLAETTTSTPSPSKQARSRRASLVNDGLDQSITELEEEIRKSQPSTPQHDEEEDEQDPIVATAIAEIPQPRKQKSSSSVRSQIMTLPETARLRKQASAEMMLRKQPSAEMLAVRRADASIPALPIPMSSHIRGNAFGKQGSHASLQTYRAPPPRTSSMEGLTERNRKRSVTDLAPAADPDPIPLPLRPKRSIIRSNSDARRPANLRMRKQASHEHDFNHLNPSPSALVLQSPAPLSSADSESWPLTPEVGHAPEPTYPRAMSVEPRFEDQEQAHIRNTSGNSFRDGSRLLSPDHTPRRSRNGTPHATPKSRNRTNTTQHEGAERDRDYNDLDSISVAGSTAPSVMSAQWYRPPRERLGLGTRVSRSEILPWELGAPEDEGPPVPPKPKTPPQKSKKFSMFPSRAPSRMKDNFTPDSPPRSPLLTEKFLVDVKDSLPESPRRQEDPRPSTSMKSREGATTPDWSRKKQKKEKEKKESRFPTFGEMISEYKGMTHLMYTHTYADEFKEQKLEKESKRPATGNTSLSSGSKVNGGGSGSGHGNDSMDIQTTQTSQSNKSHKTTTPRPSRDMGSSHTSASSKSQEDKDKKKKKKKSGAFPTMKEMWSEYKNMGNSWYTAPYQAETPRDIASPQSGFS